MARSVESGAWTTRTRTTRKRPKARTQYWKAPPPLSLSTAAGSCTSVGLSFSSLEGRPLLGGEDQHMNVAAWLQGLSLERYEPLFRDNEIDWEVLSKLTSEDLKEIGVVAIGHRRKLLDAITALGAAVPATRVTAAASGASVPRDAERRQLTIMFCDLVGSTALASRLDPEDLREVLGAYHVAVAEVVTGFGGYVAKHMGDGVLAYFGYPHAQEHDAEQAVRAGLALGDRLGRLKSGADALASRVET